MYGIHNTPSHPPITRQALAWVRGTPPVYGEEVIKNMFRNFLEGGGTIFRFTKGLQEQNLGYDITAHKILTKATEDSKIGTIDHKNGWWGTVRHSTPLSRPRNKEWMSWNVLSVVGWGFGGYGEQNFLGMMALTKNTPFLKSLRACCKCLVAQILPNPIFVIPQLYNRQGGVWYLPLPSLGTTHCPIDVICNM